MKRFIRTLFGRKTRTAGTSGRVSRPPQASLQVEALEARWCLSQTTVALIDGHVLSITGDNLANNVEIVQNDETDMLTVTDRGGAVVQTTSFNSSQIDKVVVDLQGGNDIFKYVLANDTNFTFAKQLNIALGDGTDEANLDFRGAFFGDHAGEDRLLANLDITVDAGMGDDYVVGDFNGKDGGFLTFRALMGDGTDFARASLYADVTAGAYVLFDLQGGAGLDGLITENNFGRTGMRTMNISADSTVSIKMDGGLDDDVLGSPDDFIYTYETFAGKVDGGLYLDLHGGLGNDEIHCDLIRPRSDSTGFIYVRADGDDGDDDVSAALQSDLYGADVYFSIQGSAGNDELRSHNSFDRYAGLTGKEDDIEIGVTSHFWIRMDGGDGRDLIGATYSGYIYGVLNLDLHGDASNDEVRADVVIASTSHGCLNANVQGENGNDRMACELTVYDDANMQCINATLQGNDGFDGLIAATRNLPAGTHAVDVPAFNFEYGFPSTQTQELQFGTPGAWYTGVDQDGDIYTVKLTGGGQFSVVLHDPDSDGKGPISQIVVQNTDPLRSRLAISVQKAVGGDGIVTIGLIQGSGLRSIMARSSDLVGAGIILSGPLGSLSIHDVADSTDITAGGIASERSKITANAIGADTQISLGSSISSFVAEVVGDGSIMAPSIGKLAVRGDFLADLRLTGTGDSSKPTSLNWASIGGSITDAVWSILGNVGFLTVKGAVTNWKLNADALRTARFGEMEGVLLDVAKAVTTLRAQTFSDSSLTAESIAAFTVTGIANSTTLAFANSNVTANTIGNVNLASVDTDNGGTKFGIMAEESINALTVRTPNFKFDKTKATPQGLGDFEVSMG